jgi:hypothetical protein
MQVIFDLHNLVVEIDILAIKWFDFLGLLLSEVVLVIKPLLKRLYVFGELLDLWIVIGIVRPNFIQLDFGLL